MKKRFLIIIMALLLASTLALAGCGLFGGGGDDDDDSSGETGYTITFKNYDGSVLQSGKVKKGQLPEYKEATPQKPSDDEYDYTFIGWDKEIVKVTDAATYTAQFEDIKNDYESGNGSENIPYIIISAQQLTLFAVNVNEGQKYAGKYFALGADIDLKGVQWTPIGKRGLYFMGNFDGKGFIVKNFVITASMEFGGLFGVNGGNVQNLGVTGFTVDITEQISYAGGLAGQNYGAITDCYSSGNVTVNATEYNAYAGGLIGRNDGELTNCHAAGDVTAIGDKGYAYAGGLVGNNWDTVTNCYAVGSATATYFWPFAGGLIGRNDGVIKNSYAVVTVAVTSAHSWSYAFVGGLVGENYGTIANCYAAGDATANSYNAYAGGLVGYNPGTITNCYAAGDITATSPEYACAGGLVGENGGILTNCYAAGDVIATAITSYAYAGGLVGNNYREITNCYTMGNITAISTEYYASAGGLVGKNDGRSAIINSYCYQGQAFYRKEGETEYSAANNDEGEPCNKANLNTMSFYTTTLGWSAEVWDFLDLDFDAGLYPVLR